MLVTSAINYSIQGKHEQRARGEEMGQIAMENLHIWEHKSSLLSVMLVSSLLIEETMLKWIPVFSTVLCLIYTAVGMISHLRLDSFSRSKCLSRHISLVASLCLHATWLKKKKKLTPENLACPCHPHMPRPSSGQVSPSLVSSSGLHHGCWERENQTSPGVKPLID